MIAYQKETLDLQELNKKWQTLCQENKNEQKSPPEWLDSQELKKKWQTLQGTSFVGFVRMSDATEAIFLDGGDSLPSLEGANPFLYEAALYSPRQKSIAVRQFNDRWLWEEVDWYNAEPPRSSETKDEFIVYEQLAKAPQAPGGYRKMRFYTQYVKKINCGFPQLVPGWNAFIGFAEEGGR